MIMNGKMKHYIYTHYKCKLERRELIFFEIVVGKFIDCGWSK